MRISDWSSDVWLFRSIPISGFKGDNITALSDNMPWFKGPALIAHLEGVEVAAQRDVNSDFRLPVQWVNRPNLDFRGFSGQRSEERRVGKECVSTCRSRWWPYN